MVLHHIDDMAMLGFPVNNLDKNMVIDFKALQLSSDDEDETFHEDHIQDDLEETLPKPTAYTISTMTILTGVNSRVDLEIIYENLQFGSNSPDARLLNVRFGSFPARGEYTAKSSTRKNSRTRKIFLNQISMDVQLQRKVSMKLFRDGKVQLAGCLSETDAVTAAQILIVHLLSVQDMCKQGTMRIHMTKAEQAQLVAAAEKDNVDFSDLLHNFHSRHIKRKEAAEMQEYEVNYIRWAVERKSGLEPLTPEIVMINSDMDTFRPIDKDMFKHHLTSTYGLACAPSTPKYPGAVARFVSSANCTHGCEVITDKRACAALQKKNKRQNGCVAVAILAFQQGKVIITGARSLQQLDETYKFVCHVFENEYQFFKAK